MRKEYKITNKRTINDNISDDAQTGIYDVGLRPSEHGTGCQQPCGSTEGAFKEVLRRGLGTVHASDGRAPVP